MASVRTLMLSDELRPFPPLFDDIPILYEDEEEGDMGENDAHVTADEILHIGLKTHLAVEPELQAFSNMNLYYLDEPLHPVTGSQPYASPDDMVVQPFEPLGENAASYKIGRDGPAPLLAAEILSPRSAQQGDLKEKPILYAKLGIREYLLIDPLGKYLPQRLLLKRLQPDRTWRDEIDPDGGVTSLLGFRLIFEDDDQLRMIDAETGRPYIRPLEAEDKVREAEELALLADRAQRKAERERKKAEQERDRVEEKLQRAEEERQRAEENQRKAEEARQQVDADLQAANQRIEREAAARRQAEEQLQALQAELARLRERSADG